MPSLLLSRVTKKLWKMYFAIFLDLLGKLFVSFPRPGYCEVFFVGKCLKVFGSGQSDVSSETSMTTCCVVSKNMYSGDPGNQYCMDLPTLT